MNRLFFWIAIAASGFMMLEMCAVYGPRAGFWAGGIASWVAVAVLTRRG